MTFWQKFTLLNKRIKRVIYSGIIVFIYAITGFFILPLILKPLVIDTLTEKLVRPVHIEAIEFNPFTLSISLKKLKIEGKHTDTLLGFDLLTVNVQVLPLIHKTIAFDEIIINKLNVSIIILSDGNYNFQDIVLKNSSSENEGNDENTTDSAWVLSIDKFRHNEGSIHFSDQSREAVYNHQVKEINVALDNFSTKPGDNNIHEVNAKTSQGTELNWRGNFSLSPLQSSGDISLVSQLDVISDYLQQRASFDITQGLLKINSHYDFNFAHEEPEFNITNLLASISALEIRRQIDNKKIISVDEITLDVEQFSSLTKKILINSLSNQGNFIAVNRNDVGQFDIAELFILQNSNEAVAPAQVITPDESVNNTVTSTTGSESENWDLAIKKVSTTNTRIVMNDNSVSPVANHEVILKSITIDNLKPFTDEVALISSNIHLNNQGVIKTTGTIKPKSKQLSLVLDIDKISLKDLQPYINDVAKVKILDGALATDLTINIEAANAEPIVQVNGDIKISALNVVEARLGEKLLSWESLSLENIEFSYPEQRFSLTAINIKDPSLRFIINEDSTTNIQQLLITDQDNTPITEADKTEPKSKINSTEENTVNKDFIATINKINIINAGLDFSDRSLIPKFNAGIYNLHGDISELSSNKGARAKIDLAGKVDKYAPVTIKGAVNPFSDELYTDIEMLFKEIELTTFTPYSGKFAGYKIDKGKLSLGLNYKLSENKLIAENKVTLDQFTLGEAVSSKEATSLPIKLALSLLKDSNGIIEISLPIRGDIDNPDFHYASVIWGALGNVITGIISSPFKALASLVGGNSDDLDHVTFTANSFNINEAEQTKLKSLAKALLQKPALYIEIRGLSSPLIDHDEMAYAKVLKKLKLAPRTLSDALTADEKSALVAYATRLPQQNLFQQNISQLESVDLKAKTSNEAEENTTPNDLAKKVLVHKVLVNKGLVQNESQESLKEQAFTHAINVILAETVVTEAEYLELAKQRALQIQKYFIEIAQVPSVNVFLLDSRVALNDEKASVEKSKIMLPLSLKAK